MRRIQTILISLCIILTGLAAEPISFKFSAKTIEDGPLKSHMESNISALLTQINIAAENGVELNLADINMTENAKKRLNYLWDVSAHFSCDKKIVIAKCLKGMQGFQVRGIPVTMKPLDASYPYTINRYLTLSFDRKGDITGIGMELENHEMANDILKIYGKSSEENTKQRREILKWTEDFILSFEIKDMDAIISYLNGETPKEVETNQRQFISSLKRMMAMNSFCSEVDNISLLNSAIHPNIYGLTIHQTLKTDKYINSGWYFFLMDYNDPEKLQIHLHTWQTDAEANEKGLYTLDDFYIP